MNIVEVKVGVTCTFKELTSHNTRHKRGGKNKMPTCVLTQQGYIFERHFCFIFFVIHCVLLYINNDNSTVYVYIKTLTIQEIKHLMLNML